MTHFTALIVLPADTSNIPQKVAELLKPYYSELEVEPHKEYFDKALLQAEIEYLSTFSKEDIDKLAIKYEVSGENLIEDLAKINLDWYEEDIAGVDEYGEYEITTMNTLGKWDWYTFIEAEPREVEPPINYPCKVADLLDVMTYAVVTPDGKWYELGLQVFKRNHLMGNNNIISEEEIKWDLQVREILSCYSDFIAVALNCHN